MHGTTFGGGPLACAVAIAVMETIDSGHLLAHVTETGTYFRKQLSALAAKHDCIVDVRGLGLMLAMELASAEQAKDALNAMLAKRIIINRTHETVLRFLPPFLLNKAEIDTAVQALDEIFTEQAAEPVRAHTGGHVG
jgi:acetylornithine/N-succinyldiaminopimelate aminotransferase